MSARPFSSARMTRVPGKDVVRAAFLLGERAVSMGLLAVFNVAAAREFGPDAFGSLVFALGTIGLFAPLLDTGQAVLLQRIGAARSRSQGVYRELNSAAVVSALLLIPVLAAVLVIAVLTPDSFLGGQRAVVVSAISLLFRPAFVVDYLLQDRAASGQSSLYRFVGTLSGCVARLLAVVLPLDVVDKIMLFALGSVLDAAASAVCYTIIWSRLSVGARRAAAVARVKLSGYARDALPIVLTSAAAVAYMRVDVLMLSYLSDPVAVATYGVAVRCSEVIYFAPVALGQLFGPRVLSEAHQPGRAGFGRRAVRLYVLFFGIAVTLTALIFAFARPVVATVFGEEYVALGAPSVLAVHCLSLPFIFLIVWQQFVSMSDESNSLAVGRALVGLIVNVCANLAVLPTLGAMGAAITTLATYFIVGYMANAMSPRTRYVLCVPAAALKTVWTKPTV